MSEFSLIEEVWSLIRPEKQQIDWHKAFSWLLDQFRGLQDASEKRPALGTIVVRAYLKRLERNVAAIGLFGSSLSYTEALQAVRSCDDTEIKFQLSDVLAEQAADLILSLASSSQLQRLIVATAAFVEQDNAESGDQPEAGQKSLGFKRDLSQYLQAWFYE
ncbi:MAG: hypothetical protein KBC95_02005 [Candidatus Peribacteraceae bacterium]|nr:hypothetical protein [Candidatus Peribacteraceae bacterium]